MNALAQNIALMFADVSGSAKLFGHLDDNAANQAITACVTLMSAHIEAFNGRLKQIAGDELIAAFDTADAASLAAIAMQQGIADLPPVAGLKLSIRIGLHLGPANEASGRLTGKTFKTAARIAALATSKQILLSSSMVAALPKDSRFSLQSTVAPRYLRENGADLEISPLIWLDETSHPEPEQPLNIPAQYQASPKRLSVHYRGKTLLLDEKLPVILLGRDLENQLVVEDRKASRQHARIEKRSDGYYLVDNSTNGSFIALSGQQELMLRRQEMRLQGSGRICFGSSGNNLMADCAEFDHG